MLIESLVMERLKLPIKWKRKILMGTSFLANSSTSSLNLTVVVIVLQKPVFTFIPRPLPFPHFLKIGSLLMLTWQMEFPFLLRIWSQLLKRFHWFFFFFLSIRDFTCWPTESTVQNREHTPDTWFCVWFV